MFLTVGIAVYNIKEEFLRACIESVAANEGDFEIIIADDCSNNGAGEICREYARRDGRIRYVRNEKNMGISYVRNRIIDEAKGEWITFVDGDDMVSEKLCRTLHRLNYGKLDFVRFGYVSFDAFPPTCKENKTLVLPGENTVLAMGASAAVRHKLYGGDLEKLAVSPGRVTAAMLRRSFVVKNGCRFDTDLKTAEDSLFSAELCIHKPRMAVLGGKLYYYRHNPDSVTNKYDRDSAAVTDMYLKKIRRFIDEKLSSDKKITEYFYRYRCNLAIIDNFERNIFHKDNTGTIRERKSEFLRLVSSKPYSDGLKFAGDCDTSKTRLILTLAAKKRFFAIDFLYRHPFALKLYGGICRRTEDMGWKKR